MTNTPYTTALLPDLAVIEATGADTAAFLQGQLSNDINGLSKDTACLAAYCTPKGRMLASLVVWKAHDAPEPVYRALVKRDIAPAIVKRLSMFVLRAKVKLALLPVVVYGVTADKGNNALPPSCLLDDLPASAQAWQVTTTAQGMFVAAPSATEAPARWWFVASHQQNTDEPQGLADDATRRWAADDIAAGLPWVELANQELFIPQTLNFDLIGGVSFTKGCYPGQEVVARSHYRGTVKRRMARGVVTDNSLDATTLAGQDTFNAKAPDGPVGRIVNAVNSGGTTHLLLEVQLADIGQADFRLGSPQGPVVTLADLPYPIDPHD
ncbi:MAG: folate-binding protein YgfZ [Alcaligenaceae bacterium]|nr:folate-binding protein YgfZ [Alcaligenaceae bacterium]